MAHHIVEAKRLQSKSKVHEIIPQGDNIFGVTSGASGNTYRVVLLLAGGATCSCPWGQYRPYDGGHKSGCSHVMAVYAYIEAQVADRRVSAWTDAEQVARQHRPAWSIGDGVILTSRKART